jgi:hypothetical protein
VWADNFDHTKHGGVAAHLGPHGPARAMRAADRGGLAVAFAAHAASS